MTIFTGIIASLILLVLGIMAYFLIRNQWVYTVRIKLLDKSVAEYMNLPTYDYMMYGQPFTWNIEDFLE